MVGIKNFEMPSCCCECQMASCKGLSGQFYCDVTTYDVDMDDTERDADCPLVEAIPKAEYEARLKADLKAFLVELQLEIEELDLKDSVPDYQKGADETREYIADLLQQKIDAFDN